MIIRSKQSVDEASELKKLLRLIAVSTKTHQSYLKEVEGFIGGYNYYFSLTKNLGEIIPIQKLKLIESKIFEKQYLVAYMEDSCLNDIAPNCDAVATAEVTCFNLNSPPLVIVPKSKSRSKSKQFQMVLEHEFAHVNQAIIGKFPEKDSFSKNIISALIDHMLAEYQAYYIEFSYFPEAASDLMRSHGYSLQGAAVLRAYTQALEAMVDSVFKGEVSATKIKLMLKNYKKLLPVEFKRIGLGNYAAEYVEEFPWHLTIAVTKALNALSSPCKNEGFLVLNQWIASQLKKVH